MIFAQNLQRNSARKRGTSLPASGITRQRHTRVRVRVCMYSNSECRAPRVYTLYVRRNQAGADVSLPRRRARREKGFTVLLEQPYVMLAHAKYALQALAYDARGSRTYVRIKARRAFLTSRRMPVSHATNAFRRFGIARMHMRQAFPRVLRFMACSVPAAGHGSATGNGWCRQGRDIGASRGRHVRSRGR